MKTSTIRSNFWLEHWVIFIARGSSTCTPPCCAQAHATKLATRSIAKSVCVFFSWKLTQNLSLENGSGVTSTLNTAKIPRYLVARSSGMKGSLRVGPAPEEGPARTRQSQPATSPAIGACRSWSVMCRSCQTSFKSWALTLVIPSG